jgi:negative regulator of flagellin synthesis FlgM
MEIDGKNPQVNLNSGIQRLESSQTSAPRAQRPGGDELEPGSDRIELSIRGREVQRLNDMIQSTPDIRADRVEQVRNALESGTYNVRAEMIADKILGGDVIDEMF